MAFPRLAALLALPICSAAWPATFKVTKTTDSFDGVCDADCSLREAVQAANERPGRDTIVLQAATYVLSIPTAQDPSAEDPAVDEDANALGDLDIGDDLLVKGVRPVPGGAPVSAIDAGRLYRALEVLPGAAVELRDLGIVNGWVPERGGGLANGGDLRLVRVRVAGNQAASGFNLGQGGGLFNEGTLSMIDCVVENNDAAGGEASAGEGGGLYNTGTLRIERSLFRSNRTHDDNDIGGGGALLNRGDAWIDRSLLRGNSTSSNGHGGAVANRGGGRLAMQNTTLAENHSGEPGLGGGALANGTRFGDAGGPVHLVNVTIADNNGGGIFNAGSVTWVNALVAGNYATFGGPDRFYGAGNNCENAGEMSGAGGASILLGADGNCVGDFYVDNASAIGTAIAPLADNGGPTLTFLPLPGPYAVDTSQAVCPRVDQRGRKRPADGDGDHSAACDIGAVERQPRE